MITFSLLLLLAFDGTSCEISDVDDWLRLLVVSDSTSDDAFDFTSNLSTSTGSVRFVGCEIKLDEIEMFEEPSAESRHHPSLQSESDESFDLREDLAAGLRFGDSMSAS